MTPQRQRLERRARPARATHGFSLLEILIVATVLGVVAAVAIPVHRDQTLRAQFAEGLELATPLKAAVVASYRVKGAWPSSTAEAGLVPRSRPASPYVQSLKVGPGGVITVTFGEAARPELRRTPLTLTPAASPNGEVAWACGGLPTRHRPAACRA